MDAFVSSTLAIALAEIGDKTQLLALFLTARFKQKYLIILGITVATLLNHAVSAWFGIWIANYLKPDIIGSIVGISFIVVGLWLLKPDNCEEVKTSYIRSSVFITSCALFFMAEIGDKTQIATVLLAAKYNDFMGAILGTTLGMLLANIPVIFLGGWLMRMLPLKTVRYSACILFCLLGVVTLVSMLYP